MGRVAVETLIEIRRDSSLEQHFDAAAVHLRIDWLIEIPALALVVCTGAAMLMSAELTGLLIIQLVFAAIAVLSNAVCVWIVIKRKQATKIGIEAVNAESERMNKLGLPLLVSWFAALTIGTYPWLSS